MKNKFKGKVDSYDWEDHHSPAISVIFELWMDMYKYINQDPDNVIAVHWNAGKGRTGTGIAAYLLYSGVFNTSEAAIDFYGQKRFSHGVGVTQPSQLRYVRYFEEILNGNITAPTLKLLKRVEMHTMPNIKKNTCRPFVEIIQVKNVKTLFSAKKFSKLQKYTASKRTESGDDVNVLSSFVAIESNRRSSNTESDGDRFSWIPMMDPTTRLNNQAPDTLDQSNNRNSTLNDKDKPSLFNFNDKYQDIHATSKRRSNSVGEEANTEEEDRFKFILEPLTNETSNPSRATETGTGSYKEPAVEEEGKYDENSSEDSGPHRDNVDSQYLTSEDSNRMFSTFVSLRPGETTKLDIYEDMKIWGDLLFKFMHKGSINTHLIWRLGWNTSFLENTSENIFSMSELDPCSILGNKKFHEEFAINIIVEEACEQWDSQTPIQNIWGECYVAMDQEISLWKGIIDIVNFRNENIVKKVV